MMATKIGKAMLGNELPATLNGLIVRVSLWLALFLSYFPSVFFFFHAISPARVSRQGRAGVVLLVSLKGPRQKETSSQHVLLHSLGCRERACRIVHWILKFPPSDTHHLCSHFIDQNSHMIVAILEGET